MKYKNKVVFLLSTIAIVFVVGVGITVGVTYGNQENNSPHHQRGYKGQNRDETLQKKIAATTLELSEAIEEGDPGRIGYLQNKLAQALETITASNESLLQAIEKANNEIVKASKETIRYRIEDATSALKQELELIKSKETILLKKSNLEKLLLEASHYTNPLNANPIKLAKEEITNVPLALEKVLNKELERIGTQLTTETQKATTKESITLLEGLVSELESHLAEIPEKTLYAQLPLTRITVTYSINAAKAKILELKKI